MDGLMDGIKGLLRGLFQGMFYGIVFAALFIAILNVVLADEAIPTYEARLGEQDRSLNYRPAPQIVVEHTHEIIMEIDHLVQFQCEETNLYLKALLTHIAMNIAEIPELGYLYKDALLTIREAWCDD